MIDDDEEDEDEDWLERQSKLSEEQHYAEQRYADVDRWRSDVWASLLKGLVCATLLAVFGNEFFPMDGIRLLFSNEKSSARLVETYETESGEDDRGKIGIIEVGVYRFSVGDGEFKVHESTNELGEYENVIYFPGDPKINMIDRGFRGWLIWVFQRVIFSGFIFLLPLLGSLYFLREAVRSRRKIQEANV